MTLVSLMIQLPSLNICELAVHITIHVHPMEAYIQQLHPFLTFNLSTTRKQAVSFRPRPSHPRGNNPWLCGPQQLVWTFWRRETKSLPLPGIKPWIAAQSLSSHFTLLQTDHKASPCMQRMSLAGFVLFIQSIRRVFLPETISMINFLVCLQSNYWLSHVFLSCFWNKLTPSAWVCMKIHSGVATKISQYNPILVKTGQK